MRVNKNILLVILLLAFIALIVSMLDICKYPKLLTIFAHSAIIFVIYMSMILNKKKDDKIS